MNQALRSNPLLWALLFGGVLLLLLFTFNRSSGTPELDISEVLALAQTNSVTKIEIQGDKLTVTTTEGETFKSRKESSVSVLELLEERGVDTGANGIEIAVKSSGSSGWTIFFSFLPIILIGGFIFWMFRRARGGMNQMMSMGKSQAKVGTEDRPLVTFDSVAGVDEAKVELAEIVEFLKYPEKFTKLGAKIPRGVLLVGPPGTGKTLISKAVAGEAAVPFFSLSGSEFVEMFVGVGASRVRDLFNRAKATAPSLIFIDEIDAVGRHRGAGIGGGNDEREQTLNQILVEMDGFDERANVIVVAATNRPDILDPALLRPGRFDRRVVLDLPDIKGREAILEVHLKGKPVAPDVEVGLLARETHGFSGADLANLVNEAAIMAARQDREGIEPSDFEEAVDRVIAGPARKSKQVSAREREIIAYHEAGHALVAAHVDKADPVQKVTIVPRGTTGGYTRMLPEEDRALWSKGQFEAMLAVMMGGKTAEEIEFGDITTGASNDLQHANQVARKMVTEFGMTEGLGPQTFGGGQEIVFLGKELAQGHNYSEAVAQKIDNEIGTLLQKAQRTARNVLEENRARLTRLAKRLLVEETIVGAELHDLLTSSVDEAPATA